MNENQRMEELSLSWNRGKNEQICTVEFQNLRLENLVITGACLSSRKDHAHSKQVSACVSNIV